MASSRKAGTKAISTLLHHIACGHVEDARKLLDENPKLLNKSGHLADPHNHHYEAITAYQLALAAEHPEIIAMIEERFHRIPGGAHEMQRQKESLKLVTDPRHVKIVPGLNHLLFKSLHDWRSTKDHGIDFAHQPHVTHTTSLGLSTLGRLSVLGPAAHPPRHHHDSHHHDEPSKTPLSKTIYHR